MLKPCVSTGKITTFANVDVIVTLIDSIGFWVDKFDLEIKAIAQDQYHRWPRFILTTNGELTDQQIIVAKGERVARRHKFKDVMFVVDCLESQLHQLVFIALKEAEALKYDSIAIPLMRSGMMRGQVEQTDAAIAAQTVLGVKHFLSTNPRDLKIHVVVDNNPKLAERLSRQLGSD